MLVCVIIFRVERSSDQVIKPVNLEALTKWVGNIPDDVVRDMADIAPMLSVLGYDPYANPPAYGSPDAFVADNTKRIRANVQLWEDRAKDLLSPQRTFQNVNIEDSASEAPPAPVAAWSPHLRCFLICWLLCAAIEQDDNAEYNFSAYGWIVRTGREAL